MAFSLVKDFAASKGSAPPRRLDQPPLDRMAEEVSEVNRQVRDRLQRSKVCLLRGRLLRLAGLPRSGFDQGGEVLDADDLVSREQARAERPQVKPTEARRPLRRGA